MSIWPNTRWSWLLHLISSFLFGLVKQHNLINKNLIIFLIYQENAMNLKKSTCIYIGTFILYTYKYTYRNTTHNILKKCGSTPGPLSLHAFITSSYICKHKCGYFRLFLMNLPCLACCFRRLPRSLHHFDVYHFFTEYEK